MLWTTTQETPHSVFGSQPDRIGCYSAESCICGGCTNFNLGELFTLLREMECSLMIGCAWFLPLAGRDFLAKLRQTLAARIVMSPFSMSFASCSFPSSSQQTINTTQHQKLPDLAL
ncbi:hypothetical protein HII31_09280 [Pseudocercospora fuligena]|uniref:Uncharacterized protein n=1 Tax=Pseudocercospora fuligena TaxID=685502 RepID=A0A8H6RCP7_9PEZI|nr:hypothetical protein HII31_09280 [Pseudocercospora fuligena]